MATKQIRIDEEVRAALAERAQNFETPNEVLRRLLELPPKPRRQPAQPATPPTAA
jgi:hypothetical protein